MQVLKGKGWRWRPSTRPTKRTTAAGRSQRNRHTSTLNTQATAITRATAIMLITTPLGSAIGSG